MLDRHQPLDADTVEALDLDSTGRNVPLGDTFPYTMSNLPRRALVRLLKGDRYYAEAVDEVEYRLLKLQWLELQIGRDHVALLDLWIQAGQALDA